MSDERFNQERRVALQEELQAMRADIQSLTSLVTRFDSAIDRLTQLSHSIDRLTAVQETRLGSLEQQNEIVHKRIGDVGNEFDLLEKRVRSLEQLRWFAAGVTGVVIMAMTLFVEWKS